MAILGGGGIKHIVIWTVQNTVLFVGTEEHRVHRVLALSAF